MGDYVVRGVDKDKNFRFFGSITKDIVQQAFENHVTSPVVTAGLGRTMTAVAMMSQMLKNEKDRVSVNIKGDGPIEGVIVEASSNGDIKGYPYNPVVDIALNDEGNLDVSAAFGNAVMTVMKDLGLKEPYVGQTILVSGEIAEDFTYYFATSEQTPSAVGLGVLVDVDYSVKQSGGFIIQVLPDADEGAITKLEENIAKLPSITSLLDEGKSIEEIIERLLGEVRFYDKVPIKFVCDCSKEQMERGLLSIGEKELTEIKEEDEKANLVCHFCNANYDFNKEDLNRLIEEINEQ